MPAVHIFNPATDLALAHGGDNYVAPPFARRLAADLATLPLWLARPGDVVLTSDEADAAWIDTMSSRYGLGVGHILPAGLSSLENGWRVMPWGWNAPLRKRLVAAGASESLLPTVAQVQRLRELSHRRTSITLHEQLRAVLGRDFSPVPVELRTIADVRAFASLHPGCYIKAPWSGSGHGVFRVIDNHAIDFAHWCQGVLQRQGSVLCEVALPRTADFAIEFYRDDIGSVELAGYSVFKSDIHSQYSGGLVAPREELHRLIAMRCPEIDDVCEALRCALQSLLKGTAYVGYLGVDMLTYSDSDGNERLDPCVELNLRSTMGAVSARLGELGLHGVFSIEQNGNGDGIALTPSYADTRYQACVRKS